MFEYIDIRGNSPAHPEENCLRRLINMKKTGFDKIKEQLIREGWIEQECGTVYINGEYATNLYNKDESEVIHLSYNTFADEELIDTLKGKG